MKARECPAVSAGHYVDSAIIGLCLSIFDWAPFRSTNGGKMLTSEASSKVMDATIPCRLPVPKIVAIFQRPVDIVTKMRPSDDARIESRHRAFHPRI
jgi:hypothetical protein